MGEILFRGKRIDNREQVEGFLVICDDRYFILPKTKINCLNPEWLKKGEYAFCCFIEVRPETIVQYTGLTDKNGKKIFEGDMCRVTRPCVLAYGKITFQNGCFWFVDDGEGGMLRLCDVKINGFQIEVIGNIHDNPELMEESV